MNPDEFQCKITPGQTEKTTTPEKRNGKPLHPPFFTSKTLAAQKKTLPLPPIFER